MSPESIIRSRQNPIYKQIRSLLRRDRRYRERAFLVEGPRFIADALATGATPSLIAVTETFASSGVSLVAHAELRVLSDDLMATLSDTVTPQGAIAVFPFPELPPIVDREPLILIADGIQDPGNLGALIRSAAGAGATQVVTLAGTSDPWAPKAVRAAAAAQFLIPLVSVPASALPTILPDRCRLFAADASGTARYDTCDLTGPIAIAVGSEGGGLSPTLMGLEPIVISIHLDSKLESLNAAVAGSVILFEASRQRRKQPRSTKVPVPG